MVWRRMARVEGMDRLLCVAGWRGTMRVNRVATEGGARWLSIKNCS